MANSEPVVIASDQSSIPITDNGGSVTVDSPVGTPTFVRLSDGSAAITTLPVSLASVPSHAVTNAGTFAVQSTIAAGATNIAKAEDVASSDADVGVPAMAVRKATPANTSGTDGDYEFLQISAGRLWTSSVIDTALPAGTNAIGKLSANSGVDIGDVDVTTVGTITPGTAATSLGKAEDASHTSGDVGVMSLAVRSNTAASTSGSDGDYQPLITNTTGHLWVDASGQTLTVGSHAVTNAGTFAVQAAQSGTWTVQPGNTANTTAWKVDASSVAVPITDNSGSLTVDAPVGTPAFVRLSDGSSAITTLPVSIAASVAVTGTFWQATQPVSLSSVPSHAVTNAGTFAIQDSDRLVDNAAFTDGTTKLDAVGFVYDEVAGTALTENDIAAARINVNRALVGAIEDGSTRGRYATVTASNAVKVDGSAVTQPVSGTFWQATQPVSISGNQAVNVAQMNGVTVTMGNGASGTGVQRVTIASDSTGQIALAAGSATIGALTANQSVNVAQINGVATTMGNGASGTGVLRVTIANDSTGVITPIAATSGGATPYVLISAATTNATSVKGSAGQIYSVVATNTNASARYLKLYNKASAPTVGTDTPVQVYLIPGGSSGLSFPIPIGIQFTTGIAFALTTGVANSDTAAVAANEIVVNLSYK